MTADRRGRAALLPCRLLAVLTALAAVLLTLGSAGDARPLPAATHLAPSVPATTAHPSPSLSPGDAHLSPSGSPGDAHLSPSGSSTDAHLSPSGSPGDVHVSPSGSSTDAHLPPSTAHAYDTRPYGDDAYVGARTLLVRPERDAGERTLPAGPQLFTAAHTPPVPPRPARPAPAAGHAPPAAAHVPSDLGRAPPAASST
ncbi:hypothetical protein ACWDY7_23790 [Streptomyces calvus]|uniref:Uncharacterized protein n=1 Tax=Streptomyces calvus TaxID=67282 RepID=A0AA40VH58_9ACTN|nr:hypothetical protein [Streptomyces calvus]MBA8945797.1 hypothetical protein [Streptomyces calvus]GGP43641.1 hypothetical protein GCM10010247_15050 [Streptomyces calvus]